MPPPFTRAAGRRPVRRDGPDRLPDSATAAGPGRAVESRRPDTPAVTQVGYTAGRQPPGGELPPPNKVPDRPPPAEPAAVGLPQLISLTVERPPRLAQVR